jgi:glutamine amidotransferase
MIGIINYGAGNLGSLKNAFDYLGIESKILNEPDSINKCDHLVLPGVGSFAVAMKNMQMGNWPLAIRSRVIGDGVPLLGICLGMQLLFESSSEHGDTHGLGFLRGHVKPLIPSLLHPVPHMGWNNLLYDGDSMHPIFSRVKKHIDFYFVHSYKCEPKDYDQVLAKANYGENFAAAVGVRNIVGLQFHPEKSQDMGLSILENFSVWDGDAKKKNYTSFIAI